MFTDHHSLVYLDRRQFNNAKISRWQEDLKAYKFVLQYIEGESNVWADMLSRSPGLKKFTAKEDFAPAGQFYTVKNSKLKVYVPSWVLEDMPNEKICLSLEPMRVKPDHTCLVQAFSGVGHREIQLPSLQDSILVAEEQAEDMMKVE